MEKLVVQPLFYIFFIYGSSFLLMFHMIARGARRATSAPLISAFSVLALFGLTHGITEMIDWVRFMIKTLGKPEVTVLTYLSQGFLIISFFFLLQFGVNLLSLEYRQKSFVRVLPAVLLGVFIGTALALGITDVTKIGLLSRYSFGFGGSLLSAAALFHLAVTLKPLENQKLLKGLKVAGFGFACYAVFGGLIINPIGVLPVQLFRAACAVTIAIYTFSFLDIYKYVMQKKGA